MKSSAERTLVTVLVCVLVGALTYSLSVAQEVTTNVSGLSSPKSDNRIAARDSLLKDRQEIIVGLLKIAEDRPNEPFQTGDPRLLAITLLADYHAAEAVPFLLMNIERLPVDIKKPKPSDYPCVSALIGIGKPASWAAAIKLAQLDIKDKVKTRRELLIHVVTAIEGEEFAEAMIEKVAFQEEGYPETRAFLHQRAGERRLRLMRAGEGKRISIVGSFDAKGVSAGLAEDFTREQEIVQPLFTSVDTDGTAIGTFLGPTADASTSTTQPVFKGRELLLLADKPSEQAMKAHGEKWAALGHDENGKPNGSGPVEYVPAGRTVAVIVNPANKAEALTLDQIKSIFSGEAGSWKMVGGASGSGKINCFGLGVNDPSTVLFGKEALAISKFKGVTIKKDAAEIIAAVSMDTDAIGFVDLTAIPTTGQTVKVLAIQLGTGEKARIVPPTAANIKSSMYPLSSRIFLYVHPMASNTAKDFAKFTMSGLCDETLAKSGLIPLNDFSLAKAAMPAAKGKDASVAP